MKLAGAAAVALVSAPLFAEIALNEQLAISGYVVGSARWVDPKDGSSDSTLDLDAYKFMTVAKFEKVSITGSLYAGPDADPYVLDAYGTYNFGDGTSTTAGKFLSYLGYEAFDPVNMLQISYSNEGLTGFIPGYHTGVKFDKATDQYSIGIAVVDSIYSPGNFKGDGELDDGVGLEAVFSYTGIENVTVFTGLGYDTGDAAGDKHFVGDLWVQYAKDRLTVAGELAYGHIDLDAGGSVDGFFASALVKYKFDDKWAATFRASAGEGLAKDDFVKGTFAPSYAITENVEIVAEYSYIDSDIADYQFLGLQTRFKF
ncbi:MAG TPA: outer membrane beta-barrel protein [Opitutaceae bacterium]|nr:outer membrane beta-barrel protein [Opitutaceae bacterium]